MKDDLDALTSLGNSIHIIQICFYELHCLERSQVLQFPGRKIVDSSYFLLAPQRSAAMERPINPAAPVIKYMF